MDARLLDVLNRQLLGLDRERGSDGIVLYVLGALQRTLREYRGDARAPALRDQLLGVYEAMLGCRPRMANVLRDLRAAIVYLCDHPDADRDQLSAFFEERKSEKLRIRAACVSAAVSLLADASVVLLHALSETIRDTLLELAHLPRRPQLVVAEQEPEKTARLVRTLSECGFERNLVSEYSIAHAVRAETLLLLPALTLSAESIVSAAPGSIGLAGHVQRAGGVVWAVLSTNKFSYWEDESAAAFRIEKYVMRGGVSVRKDVYSHDPLPLDALTGLITERGRLTPAQARAVFGHLQQEFAAGQQTISALLARRRPESSSIAAR